MIKVILWDLDGTLCDIREVHHSAINKAIDMVVGAQYTIGYHEKHIYEAIPTKVKLTKLTELKKLPESSYDKISELKQKFTLEYLEAGFRTYNEYDIVKQLYQDGYKMGVCSNSVRPTIELALNKIRITDMIDCIVSNRCVKNPKPSGECFTKAMNYFGVTPRQCLVIEDSPVGIAAGFNSRAWVFPVLNPSVLDYSLIKAFIDGINGSEHEKQD